MGDRFCKLEGSYSCLAGTVIGADMFNESESALIAYFFRSLPITMRRKALRSSCFGSETYTFTICSLNVNLYQRPDQAVPLISNILAWTTVSKTYLECSSGIIAI